MVQPPQPASALGPRIVPQRPLVKPPFPTLATLGPCNKNPILIRLPSVIAGALIVAFSTLVADGLTLGDGFLAHYYLPDTRLQINLDIVLDRLLSEFTNNIWDELFDFYEATNTEHASQVVLLFDGPIRQLVLTLKGPELSKCILDKIAPGISRRPLAWAKTAGGIDFSLALKHLCRYWQGEFASYSPRGNPDDVACSIEGRLVKGTSFHELVTQIKRTLFTPHLVQLQMMESAIYYIVLKQQQRHPQDGFRILQFSFDFNPSERLGSIRNLDQNDIGSFQTITGTAGQYGWSTMSEYASRYWPKYGSLVQRCLSEALVNAFQSQFERGLFSAKSVWDDSHLQTMPSGLRLLHVEIEPRTVRLTISAWMLALVDVLQQMAWTCSVLSCSPCPERLVECHMQISDWEYQEEHTIINCSTIHRPVPDSEAISWLQHSRGAVAAVGFPIGDHMLQSPI